MLEDMPENVDRNVVAIIIGRQFGEFAAHLIGDVELVNVGIGQKKSAIVGGKAFDFVPFVNPFENGFEIGPNGNAAVPVLRFADAFNRVPRHEAPRLRKCNEQDPIENDLRVAEDIRRRKVRVAPTKVLIKLFTKISILGIKPLRNFGFDLR